MTDEELIARLRDTTIFGTQTATEAADRIEALTEQLTAARQDAVEAEAYAEGLERELRDTQDRANAFATKEYYTEMRAERAEAKLAKAVEALDEAVYLLDPDEKDMMRQAGVYRIVTTLAEIKGESHE